MVKAQDDVLVSARNGYLGTQVATVATCYPGTRSGPGYLGIFITRLLSTQHCRLDCEFRVIDNIYHEIYCKNAQTVSARHITDYR